MSHLDNQQQPRLALGDWKRELTNLLQMKGRVAFGKNGKTKPISDRTLDAREDILFMCMRQVREMGYDIKSVYSLRGKHVDALVDRWKKEEISSGAAQNRLSVLRLLCHWMGKDGLVKPTKAYAGDNPDWLKRKVAATQDKSWSALGVDVKDVIRKVSYIDNYVAMQLKVIHAFGLRREESIQLKPFTAHEGMYLRVRDGTKGGRERIIPIESAYQREVLMEAKEAASRWDGSLGRPGRNLEQNINRFSYVMKKLGITRNGLGVTAHGLRHQRLNDLFEEVAGVPSPVRQTAWIIKGDPVKWKQAQQKVSHIAGHARLSISTAYTGSARSVKRPGNPRLDWTAGKAAGVPLKRGN